MHQRRETARKTHGIRQIAGSLAGSVLVAAILAACASTEPPRAVQPAGPRDGSALLLGAESALARKEFRSAASMLAAAAAASDDETLAERASRVAYENHQSTFVLQSAQRWLELNPSSEEAHRFAGFAALQLYKIDVAAEHFGTLLGQSFISPAAGFMALGPQWFEVGSRPAVLALAQKLAARHPEVAEGQLVLAQAALQAEHLALALSSARKAVELSPYWQPARSLLARVLLTSGESVEALATMKATVEQEKSALLRLEYAQMLYAAGQEEEGRRELQSLTQSEEVGGGALRTLALIDLESGQWDAASKRWRELVQSGRFVYEGLYYLGQLAERRDEIADAIELYSRVTGTDLAVAAQARAALLKARRGKVEDGLALLQAFAAEHEEHAIEMLIAQATLLNEMDQFKRAVALLDSGIAEYPDRDDLLASKALLLERERRTSDALKTMRELLRIRPDDPTVLNMLGYTLVDRTRNVDEGLGMIKRALDTMPDNGAILDSMGWALHRLRRNEEALGYLERAHERARDPEIALHLGEVQWALGRAADARQTWEEALTRAPDNEALKEQLEKRKRK